VTQRKFSTRPLCQLRTRCTVAVRYLSQLGVIVSLFLVASCEQSANQPQSSNRQSPTVQATSQSLDDPAAALSNLILSFKVYFEGDGLVDGIKIRNTEESRWQSDSNDDDGSTTVVAPQMVYDSYNGKRYGPVVYKAGSVPKLKATFTLRFAYAATQHEWWVSVVSENPKLHWTKRSTQSSRGVNDVTIDFGEA